MTNTNKLKGLIAEKGFNLSTLSETLSISRPALRRRLNGESDFRASEIEKICTALDIPKTEIWFYFFYNDVPVLETSPH